MSNTSFSPSLSSHELNPKVSPHAKNTGNTFVIHSDSSFDPDNNDTIEISSSSSSSSSEEEETYFEHHGECITPSPYRKGYNSKKAFHPSTGKNASHPSTRHRSKRRLKKLTGKSNSKDPPSSTAGGGEIT